MRHRLGGRLRLHRGREGVHVGDLHEYRHAGRILRVDELPEAGNAEGSKELFAFRRGKPMIRVLHVEVGDHGRHGVSSCVAAHPWRRTQVCGSY